MAKPVHKPLTRSRFLRLLPDGGASAAKRVPLYIEHGIWAEQEGRSTAAFYNRGWQRRAIFEAVQNLGDA